MNPSTRPLVTIGIPTYNRAARSLKCALESALNQTYRHLEILVSDNCSTDQTGEVVASYDDPRVRYVRHERNIGPNNNFNYCVEAAAGDFFQLLHDDDLIDPDFVETCIPAIVENPGIGFVHTGTRLIDGKGDVIVEHENLGTTPSPAGFFLDWFAGRSTFYLCSTLYNTKALQKIGGFHSKHNLLQDVMACSRLAISNGRIAIRDVKASFRRHDGNFGASNEYRLWCDESLDLLNTICELLPEHADEVREAGMAFLCRMNFLEASRLSSLLRRLRGYLDVARRFGYADSPYQYAIRRELKPGVRRFKHGLRGSVGFLVSP